MYKLALLFVIVATAQAQLVSNGTCSFSSSVPPVTPINQFRSSVTLTVNMFEIKRINNTLNTGQCASVSLVVTEDGISVSLKEVVDEKLIDHNGTISGTENSGIYNAFFSDFNSNFTILSRTPSFAILYACSNKGEQKEEYAWVLGFNSTLADVDKNLVQAVIVHNKLENATWVESSHTEDSCRSGATNNFTLSSIIVLAIGFVAAKGL